MPTRREFLRYCASISIGLFGSTSFTSAIARGFELLKQGKLRVIWLSGLGCSGESISLFFSEDPLFLDFSRAFLDLMSHPLLSTAQGKAYEEIIAEVAAQGEFVLCFEGAVPQGMPEACRVGERTMNQVLEELLPRAKLLIACGTCAAFGGVSAASPETGAVSVIEFAGRKGLLKDYVRLPGCPLPPWRFMGTVAYFAATGKLPPLDEKKRPKAYYARYNHEHCQYFRFFNEDKYTLKLSEPGKCLFRFGCRGPRTYADCPLRPWNGGARWCVNAYTPCIGCAHPGFPWDPQKGIYQNPKRLQPKTVFGEEA
ncbi:hydrogenase small subunit [Thermodesulfatator atlanticus]